MLSRKAPVLVEALPWKCRILSLPKKPATQTRHPTAWRSSLQWWPHEPLGKGECLLGQQGGDCSSLQCRRAFAKRATVDWPTIFPLPTSNAHVELICCYQGCTGLHVQRFDTRLWMSRRSGPGVGLPPCWFWPGYSQENRVWGSGSRLLH